MNKPENAEQLNTIKTWLGSGSVNIFGMPFAGKDTHGRALAEALDAPLLGGGDILRGSVIPERVKQIMIAGELIPTRDYLNIVLPYLSQKQFVGKPMVLSSVGRWHGEEAGVLEATAAAGHPLSAVIYLHVSDQDVFDRWIESQRINDRGDRADDDIETIEVRLEEFRNKTLPVINFYRDMGLLIEVDGTPPIDTVSQHILDGLADFANQSK